jgi:predicted transcriptional regulator
MRSNKLKGKIVEHGLNVEKVAEKIGIDGATFYRKLKDGNFTISEAKKIKALLKLTNREAIEIFFTNDVA